MTGNIHLKKVDIVVVLIFLLGMGVILLAERNLFYDLSAPLLLIIGLTFILLMLIETYRRVEFLLKDKQDDFRQLEALFWISQSLSLRSPLPPTRGWAVSPDFLTIQISCIKEYQPKLIVELGSGVSSIVSGYCLQELGCGRIFALDHDTKFSNKSQREVRKHGLDDVVKVVDAPLIDTPINDGTWQWYDLSRLKLKHLSIDMLIVDGPPNPLQSLSRYPALPMLIKWFSSDVIILIDDAKEWNVEEAVLSWQRQYPNFVSEFIDTEKGTYLLRNRIKH